MPGAFANRSLIDPLAVLQHCQRYGLPTDWVGKANRFECVAGHESGTGAVLMTRADLDQIDLDTPHDLILHDNITAVTVKRLHLAGGTICLTPGAPLDGRAVHLVPLADHRRLFQLYPLNRGYNLRLTPGGNYQPQTATDSTTAFTWAQVWADLWAELPSDYAGTAPTLPATPDGDPESLAYHGWTVADAIGDFLARLAMTLVWNPFTDVFSVVQLGSTQAGLAAAELAAMNWRLRDAEPVDNSFGTVPGAVDVYFRKSPTRAYGNTPFEVYQIADTGSTLPGRMILHDDLQATYQSGNLTNDTDLQTRADARALEFFAARKEWYARGLHRVYAGIRNAFVPGAEVQSVTWSSFGHRGTDLGVLTQVKRMPPRDPVASWAGTPEQPWRLVEMVKVYAPPGSGSSISPPSGYFNAKVLRLDVVGSEHDELLACWANDMNGQDPPPAGRYLGLFAGFLSGRPVYSVACCPDGSNDGFPDDGGDGGDEEDNGGSSSWDGNDPHVSFTPMCVPNGTPYREFCSAFTPNTTMIPLEVTITSTAGACSDLPLTPANVTCNVVGTFALVDNNNTRYWDDDPGSDTDCNRHCFWQMSAGGADANATCDLKGYGMSLYYNATDGTFSVRKIAPPGHALGYGGPPVITGIVPISASPLHLNFSYFTNDADCGGAGIVTMDIVEA